MAGEIDFRETGIKYNPKNDVRQHSKRPVYDTEKGGSVELPAVTSDKAWKKIDDYHRHLVGLRPEINATLPLSQESKVPLRIWYELSVCIGFYFVMLYVCKRSFTNSDGVDIVPIQGRDQSNGVTDIETGQQSRQIDGASNSAAET